MERALPFDTLFDPAFLQRVEMLSLRIREAQKGGRLADQRTRARGQGADFADFKPYVAGDDLRTIDWNIFRRLNKAVVRVHEERQDLPVYLLLDVSRSMFVETPPRIHAAARAALALGAAALAQHDSVGLFAFSDVAAQRLRQVSGRGQTVRLAQVLAEVAPGQGTAPAAALAHVATMKLRRGLLVVVSDFLDEAGVEPLLRALGRLPHRLLLVQLTRAVDADPALDPDLAGDVAIDDGERGAPLALTVTPDLIDRYRAAWRTFADRLAEGARAQGATLLPLDADRDVVDQLLARVGKGLAL